MAGASIQINRSTYNAPPPWLLYLLLRVCHGPFAEMNAEINLFDFRFTEFTVIKVSGGMSNW